MEIRARKKRPGGSALTSERARYVRLMNQGMNNSQVCRMLGIDRKTGSRWRNGRRAVNSKTGEIYRHPPISQASSRRYSARYLSDEERTRIADGYRLGHSIRHIAAELGRAPSAVSRELRRNAHPTGRYTPFHAHRLAQARARKHRSWKLSHHGALGAEVRKRLLLRWSPKQISYHLRREFPDDPLMRIAPESIYQALYRPLESGFDVELFARLRRGRSRRWPHRPRALNRTRYLRPVLMITDRPFDPTDRSIPGHWEGDLIVGAGNRSAIATLVERTSRYLLLLKLAGRGKATDLKAGLIQALSRLPAHLRKSITWDQGTEMWCHEDFTTETGIPVYICHPHSPWQRGTNENTNGLLRDYFPKGTNLAVHDQQVLAAVATELNQRPRETMAWETPEHRFSQLLTNPK